MTTLQFEVLPEHGDARVRAFLIPFPTNKELPSASVRESL
jgi:hypothetical protein